MDHRKEMANYAAACNMKMAVVQVKPGESNKEAWKRHLRENPHDVGAMIKVFNQPQTTKRQSHA